MSEITSITNVILADKEWHAIGTAEESWTLISTGGTPVYMVDLPEGEDPNDKTRPTFILGGIVNKLVSDVKRQAWCCVREGIGRLSFYLSSESGFSETTQLRKSMLDLTTQVIHLAGRTHKVELAAAYMERWREMTDAVISGIQIRVADLLTNLMLHKLDNVAFQADLRLELNRTMYRFQTNILASVQKLTADLIIQAGITDSNFTTFCDGLVDMMRTSTKDSLALAYENIKKQADTRPEMIEVLDATKSMVTYCLDAREAGDILMKVQGDVGDLYGRAIEMSVKFITTDSTLQELVKKRITDLYDTLWNHIVGISKDTNLLKILVGVGADGGSSMTDVQQNLLDYWKAMTEFMNVADQDELDEKYTELIYRASFDQTFLPVVNIVYQMALAALTNVVVDTVQTERLDVVDEHLPDAKPLLGRNLKPEDIIAIFGGASLDDPKDDIEDTEEKPEDIK